MNNEKVKIYGKNFSTKDGTCIRDYIHVLDLCTAFEKTINQFLKKKIKNLVFNLGTGIGFSVLEILQKIITILKLPKSDYILYAKKRFGDNARLVCSYQKFFKYVKWKPKHSKIMRIINDEIIWQKQISLKRKFIY